MVGLVPSSSLGRQIDRRPFASETAIRVGTMVEQPSYGFLVELAGGRVKRRSPVCARRMDQRQIRLQHVERATALPIGHQEQIVRCGGRVSIVNRAPALFLFSNN